MRRIAVALLISAFGLLPLRAEVSGELLRLSDAMGLPGVIEVMRQEGMTYGDELAEGMFQTPAGNSWRQTVSGIYDAETMLDIALTGFAGSLTDQEVVDLTTFFESPLGHQIAQLEVSARTALLDEAVDAANKENVEMMFSNENPRIAMLTLFIEVNNLLETNVVGALNSNFAFYNGLVAGGAYAEPITEDQMLEEVWQQEADIRADTSEWLYGFLSLAYSPLTDAEMRTYIEFSKTDIGQTMNTALFDGFDTLFEGISYNLGLAAARVMTSQDL